MDWIKVLNRHILLEYSDLRDSEFTAWIKIMALTASLERVPSREQILKYVHYKTLISLQDKLNKHSIDLQYILNKVLIDVQCVANRRESLKQNTQRFRVKQKAVIDDVIITSSTREEKIREDKNKSILKEEEIPPFEFKDKPPLSKKEPSPPKTKHLDSVFLSEIEHKKLQEAIGQKSLEIGIEKLDYSITCKGGKYKDHYKTLLNWHRRGYLATGGNGNRHAGIKAWLERDDEKTGQDSIFEGDGSAVRDI